MKQINFQHIWEQFRKNKFFSFLSLFGISIPVMIIMIMVMKIELGIHPGGPEKNNDELLFLKRSKIVRDDGSSSEGWIQRGVITDYIAKLSLPGSLAFSKYEGTTIISQRQAIDARCRYTNADFWNVFDFKFLQGRPYTPKDVKEINNVAVISEGLSKKLYDEANVLGNVLEIKGETYRIIGVVEDVSALAGHSFAHVWTPYTHDPYPGLNLNMSGRYSVVFESPDKQSAEIIKRKVEEVRVKLDNMNGEDTRLIFSGPDGPVETYFKGFSSIESYDGELYHYLTIFSRILIILFLPALNLVSLNLTRIHERSQEIAVRKAFGATRKNLALQIVAENSILTLFGGFLGLILAYGVAYGFKEQIFSDFFIRHPEDVAIQVNFIVFVIVIGVSLLFSLLSGLIPAIKMSKLQPARVLKGGEL